MRATVDDLEEVRARLTMAPQDDLAFTITLIRSFLSIIQELEPDVVLDGADRAIWRIWKQALEDATNGGTKRVSRSMDDGCVDGLWELARKGWRGSATGHVRTLGFIRDPLLRRIAERDLASLGGAVKGEETKCCLILAGSVMEAALLDLLEADPAATNVALQRAKTSELSRRNWRSGPPEEWDLWQMIEVAGPGGFGVLAANTVTIARSLKDMRNVVHPARERRASATTAEGHLAEALALKVIEDVSAARGPGGGECSEEVPF